jgi:hypothetical protein
LFVSAGSDLAALVLDVRHRWRAAVQAEGIEPPSMRGVVCNFNWTDSEYLSKFGSDRTWSAGDELVKACWKTSLKGRNPVQLLAAWADQGDIQAAVLWQDYARAFKGQRQLAWSSGLRKLLGLGAEKSDEQLAEEKEAGGELLYRIPVAAFALVVHQEQRGELLEVAGTGDGGKLRSWLRKEIGVPDRWLPPISGG